MGTPSHRSVSLPSVAEPSPSTDSPSVRPLSDDQISGATLPRTISQGESYRHATTINILPADVLLDLFDCYQNIYDYCPRNVGGWHILAHICQRWRQIVFASPNRLNLRILCKPGTPVRRCLYIWPAFPIDLDYFIPTETRLTLNDEDNVIAALEHPDRVRDIRLAAAASQLEKVVTVMQEPFPVLKRLFICSRDKSAPLVPADFLGGSAPCLQQFTLYRIPFPALPTLLLSTNDLVALRLSTIPPTGYISPEAMVMGLAALLRLKTLVIQFESATPHPDLIRPPPVVRTVLPALTSFHFQGTSEYLEDLVAQIDGPRLDRLFVNFLDRFDFRVAQLFKFIDRSGVRTFKHAYVTFSSDCVTFGMHDAKSLSRNMRGADISTPCQGIDQQISHIAQVFREYSATLSTVVHLKLELLLEDDEELEGTDGVEWLHFLRQFPAVQTLHVSGALAEDIAFTLEDIAEEMVAEVLPSLTLVYFADWPVTSIGNFVTERQLSGLPVTIVRTKAEFYDRLQSYVSN